MLHWVSKDGLGNAIWIFWIAVIGIALSFATLTGFNSLAVQAERGAPARQAAFAKQAGLEHEAHGQTLNAKQAQRPIIVEALKRSWDMAGLPALVGLILVSLNLWAQKRSYTIKDDSVRDFIDPVASGRTVK